MINAAVASIWVEWATQQGQCDAIATLPNPVHGFFVNDAQIYTCPNGSNPTASGAYAPQTKVFGGLGQSITLIVANNRDTQIVGSDFKLVLSISGTVTGSVDIAPHTTMQEFNTVGGPPGQSWVVTYQGTVIFSNPDNVNVVTLTVIFLNPFNGGGGVLLFNNQVMVPAGVVARDTKAEANAVALKMLNDVVAANLALGTLTC